MGLQGKRVAITGANGILGRAAVACTTALGGEPVLLDIGFGDSSGPGQHAVDLSDAAATEALFAKLGPIDALLNIAGGFDMGPTTWETSTEQWQQLYTINVTTMLNTVRAVVPQMLQRGRGAIVNVGALGAVKGAANMSAYCAAKSVVMRHTESLSAELKNSNINVNAVLPSMIDTPRNRADMPDADFGQWVLPQDLANVMCFLASDAARAVHGALIPVAGKL